MTTSVLAPTDLSLVRLVPLPDGMEADRYFSTIGGFPVHRCSWIPRNFVGIVQPGDDGQPHIRWFKIEEENA